MKPQVRPHIIPTIAAIGMDLADWPRETPPTKTTASRPSRKTMTKGSVKRIHFPVRPVPVTSGNTRSIHVRDWNVSLTLSLKRLLKLDAPFSLRAVQLEHGDTHHKDHDRGNELECPYVLAL